MTMWPLLVLEIGGARKGLYVNVGLWAACWHDAPPEPDGEKPAA